MSQSLASPLYPTKNDSRQLKWGDPLYINFNVLKIVQQLFMHYTLGHESQFQNINGLL